MTPPFSKHTIEASELQAIKDFAKANAPYSSYMEYKPKYEKYIADNYSTELFEWTPIEYLIEACHDSYRYARKLIHQPVADENSEIVDAVWGLLGEMYTEKSDLYNYRKMKGEHLTYDRATFEKVLKRMIEAAQWEVV